MLRVLFRPSGMAYFNNHAHVMLRVEPILREMGVEFTDHGPFDLVWVHNTNYIRECLALGVPTVVQDLYLGPEIRNRQLRLDLNLPHVKAVAKTSVLTDPSLYAWASAGGRSQFHLERLTGSTLRDLYATQIDVAKVKLLFGLIGWNHFRKTPLIAPDFKSERSHAVVTVLGKINISCYPEAEVRQHRLQAIQVTKQLGERVPVLYKEEGVPNWSGNTWYDALRSSKTCLSPWGYDPTCFRDYEAALNGCLILKPDSSFCRTWPQVPYVPIEPDYSDFEEKVNDVLTHWSQYEEMRRSAYEVARLGLDDRQIALRYFEIMNDAVECGADQRSVLPQTNL